MDVYQITDANINRVAEGLRVIEEYTRFISKHKPFTDQLAAYRKQVSHSEENRLQHLLIRDTDADMRAKEAPPKRPDVKAVLTANFKRVEEGLRVLEEYTGNPLYNTLRYDIYMLEKDILLSLEKPQITPGVYLISDRLDVLEKGCKAGVSLIQYRDKQASKQQYLDTAKHIKTMTDAYDIPFIVNDFLDIALLVDAHGFHSGQDDISVAEQRRLLGPHKLIGRTTHSLEQGLEAQSQGADYVSVGPIWDTPSKPGRPGIGFEYLQQAKHQLEIPFVAIGGINTTNIAQVLDYSPPLIGFIRAEDHLSDIIQLMRE